ncbi:MAG: hypothetical protein ACRERE_09070 [Candidatus Entotheonellia bacterium]
MKHHTKFSHPLTGLFPILLCIVAVGGLLLGAQLAFAQDSGPTIAPTVCMQTTFSGHTAEPVPPSDRLNCTANDIRLSRAISVSPSSCLEGETFTLTGTFETNVTANARYDASFFFNIGGGANARLGTCSLSVLDPPPPANPPVLELDGDTCGDLNAGTVNLTFTIPGVLCSDPDNDGFLNLPNCTSWHSNQGTACSAAATPSPNAPTPDFAPDTKSKCVCDDFFQVPVIVETATLTVVKSASPTSVPETGQTVTYTVMVMNAAQFVSVTIDTLIDDIYGALHDPANPAVSNNTCPTLVGVVLGPGDDTSCTFQAFVSGDAGPPPQTIRDTVEVCSTQSNTGATICGDDDATVTITDVPSTPALTKGALMAVTASCTLTVNVTYEVGISNPSTVDTLTVNSLTDNQFGNITQVQGNVISTTCVPDGNPATCEVGGVIAAQGSCSCTFVGRITGGTVSGNSCTFSHTDSVTANVTDDDGVTSTPSDPDGGATVNVNATVNVSFP